MSYSFTKNTYSTQSTKTSSPSQAIEDAKKKTSLLKDNSWIRKDAEEDEPVERDPNFGRAVLSRYKPNEALDSSKSVDAKSPHTTSGSTSYVQSLTKRFSASQDELNKGSTTVATNTKNGKTTEQTTTTTTTTTQNVVKTPTKTETFTQKVFSDIKSPRKSISSLAPTKEPMTTTVTKVTVKEEPKTSTIVTTITKNGNTTEQTTTTTQNVVKTPTKTETFTEGFSDIKSPSKSIAYTPPAPSKPKVSETTEKTEDDQLYDTLIPTSIKAMLTPDGETTVSKTETVTVKSGNDCSNGESTKTTTTTKTSVTTEDKLFDTLLPTSFQSVYNTPDSTTTPTTTVTKKDIVVDSTKGVESKPVSSPTSSTRTSSSYSSYSSVDDLLYTQTNSKPREEYTKTNSIKSYSSQPDSSYEYTSVTSPSAYTATSYKDNSSRAVLEKDLCSYCKKTMSSDPKMVLEDMSINCHATCFKCEVCSSNLGNLKAGDSMWIYRRTVHCEKCFGVTREKWRR